MKTLAEFLAARLGSSISESVINNAIEAYKNHLRNDSPKTVHWAMIERDLIVALERMESKDSLEGVLHNNHKSNCASHNDPSVKGFASSVSDCDCEKAVEDMTIKELIESTNDCATNTE